MRRSTFRLAALCAAVAMLVLIPAGAALAHGHASQGDLEMEIGFATEPAYTGQPNAVQLMLVHDGQPVTDLKTGDVTVEVTFGDQTSEPMDMEPWFFYEDGKLEFGEPGEYRANFVPSQAGDYTFHFTGTVDGEKVDEEMTSSPKTFSSVESAERRGLPAGRRAHQRGARLPDRPGIDAGRPTRSMRRRLRRPAPRMPPPAPRRWG